MVRVVTFVAVLTVLICGFTTNANAQQYNWLVSVTPDTEMAVVTSGANVFELARVGAGVTINRIELFT